MPRGLDKEPDIELGKEIRKYEQIFGKPIYKFTRPDWHCLSLTQPLSAKFAKTYPKSLHWPEISMSNPAIDDIIFSDPDKILWSYASFNANLSFEAAIKYADRIEWSLFMRRHPGISLEQLMQIQVLLPAEQWKHQLRRISGTYPWDRGENTEKIFEFYKNELSWTQVLRRVRQLPEKMPQIAGKVHWDTISKYPGSPDVLDKYRHHINLNRITEYGRKTLSLCRMTVDQMTRYADYLVPKYIIKGNDPKMLLDPRIIYAFRNNPGFWDVIKPEHHTYCQNVSQYWVG